MNWCFIAVMVLLISCGQSHKGSEKTTTELSDHPVPPGKENIPAESIFQLKDSFQTQENTPFTLSFLKGTPTVVGMIFTHCTYACPRLTADIKNIADSLKGQKVNFVLVSFDTKRDNPTRLKLFAHEMGLNTNWILLLYRYCYMFNMRKMPRVIFHTVTLSQYSINMVFCNIKKKDWKQIIQKLLPQ